MSNTDHLAKAKDYLTKGEDYYRKAAEEIATAMKEDPTLSYADVASRVGKSKSWVAHLVRSFTNGQHLHDGEEFAVEWGREKPATTAKKVLRDPEQRRQVIESLDHDERTELVREVSRSATPETGGREGEREVWKFIQDAPKHDLAAQAAKFVLVASQIDLLLADGAQLQRMTVKDFERLDRDLGRVRDTVERLQEQIGTQSTVRRIA